MGARRLVLDASVIIASERGTLDLPGLLASLGDVPVVLPAVVAAELLHGCERAPTPAIRARRSAFVEFVLARVPIGPFGLLEVRRHAELWATLAQAGTLIGPHDMLIAATALAHGMALATLNQREFERVPGLRLVPATRFRPSPGQAT